MSFVAKAIKSVFKAVKKIVKGVTKIFKKVLKSPIGKALLIAGAVYLGGGVLGAWNTPFSLVTKAGQFLGGETGLMGKITSDAAGFVGTAVEGAGQAVASGGIGPNGNWFNANGQALQGSTTGINQYAASGAAGNITPSAVSSATNTGAGQMIDQATGKVIASNADDQTKSAFMTGWGMVKDAAPLISAAGALMTETDADAELRKELMLRQDSQNRYAAYGGGSIGRSLGGIMRPDGKPVYGEGGNVVANNISTDISPQSLISSNVTGNPSAMGLITGTNIPATNVEEMDEFGNMVVNNPNA